ncbi:bifunctional DNA primase/polymerase [Catellatospora sp. NPDC049609]|uniref:bifunctional DNA primase/polymerase n=1 Tax=Catellatospora sp. NPDC049609 TaxID=3155505 RepID=UPI00343ADD07
MRWPQAPFGKGLLRRRLRLAAQRYADHGWAVTPGGYFNGRRMACDRADCLASSGHPLYDDWQARSSTAGAQLDEWWSERPHAVLLPAGRAFDVIEVPALLGARAVCGPPTGPGVATSAGRVRGPVAVTAAGRWMFLMRSGGTLAPELDHRSDVVYHSLGSWIPAPPTVLPEGPLRWQVSPQRVGWQLPDPDQMQAALVRALVALDAAFLDLPVNARRRLAPAALSRPVALKPTPTLRRAV